MTKNGFEGKTQEEKPDEKLGKNIEQLGKIKDELKHIADSIFTWNSIIKNRVLAILLLFFTIVGYGILLWKVITPKLVESPDSTKVWHNIALLFFTTVVFGFFSWAIVQICKPPE